MAVAVRREGYLAPKRAVYVDGICNGKAEPDEEPGESDAQSVRRGGRIENGDVVAVVRGGDQEIWVVSPGCGADDSKDEKAGSKESRHIASLVPK